MHLSFWELEIKACSPLHLRCPHGAERDVVSLEMSGKCRLAKDGRSLERSFRQADSFLLLSVCVGLLQGEGFNVEVVAQLLDLEKHNICSEQMLKSWSIDYQLQREGTSLPLTRRSVSVRGRQRLSTRIAAWPRLRPPRSRLTPPPGPWVGGASWAPDNVCYSSGTRWACTER